MAGIISLLSFPYINAAQTPDLGTAANYVLFTAEGAVGNTGISIINGNIGTNIGDITGFEPPTEVNGTIEMSTAATAQAALDVREAYTQLMDIPPTVTDHAPVYGNGETLAPGVYYIGAAGSTAGTLILDGGGDPNAVFIFQFFGAFTTAAGSTVVLINGANANNIYWGAHGAIAMAAMTIMQGTLIAKDAISMAAGGTVVGRMLSTVGAATVDNVELSMPDAALPIELQTFTGACLGSHVVLKWTTASERNNDYFTIERCLKGQDWQNIGIVEGAGTSTITRQYSFSDVRPDRETALYRLKQTDFDAIYKYSGTIAVRSCGENDLIVGMHPNPSKGYFTFTFSGLPDEVSGIDIYNTGGQKVYSAAGMPSSIDLSGHASGIYFVKVRTDSSIMHLKVVVQ